MERNKHELHRQVLIHKYANILQGFKETSDDRIIAWNCYHLMITACEAMRDSGMENNFICCAFNDSIQEQEAKIDEIITRFTGKVYKGVQWVAVPLYHVYRAQKTEGSKDCRDVLVKSTPDGELAFRFAKQLDEMGHAVYITVTRPDGSEDRIWN